MKFSMLNRASRSLLMLSMSQLLTLPSYADVCKIDQDTQKAMKASITQLLLTHSMDSPEISALLRVTAKEDASSDCSLSQWAEKFYYSDSDGRDGNGNRLNMSYPVYSKKGDFTRKNPPDGYTAEPKDKAVDYLASYGNDEYGGCKPALASYDNLFHKDSMNATSPALKEGFSALKASKGKDAKTFGSVSNIMRLQELYFQQDMAKIRAKVADTDKLKNEDLEKQKALLLQLRQELTFSNPNAKPSTCWAPYRDFLAASENGKSCADSLKKIVQAKIPDQVCKLVADCKAGDCKLNELVAERVKTYPVDPTTTKFDCVWPNASGTIDLESKACSRSVECKYETKDGKGGIFKDDFSHTVACQEYQCLLPNPVACIEDKSVKNKYEQKSNQESLQERYDEKIKSAE